MQTALIIPALNEEPVIGITLRSLPPRLFNCVIVADNGSTDRTAEIAREHGASVVHEPRRGYGSACLKALAHLPDGIEIVSFMQADLSEHPDEIHLLIDPIVEGRADLVIGSRTTGRAEPGALLPHQQFGNWVAITLIRVLYRYQYTDLGPLRSIRKSSLDRLEMQDRDYGWTIEMQVRAIEEGLRILEVPVSYRKRAAGVNKVSGNLKASLNAGYVIVTTVLKLWARGFAARRKSRS